MGRLLTEVIHDDQARFIPNRSTAGNLRLLYLDFQLSLGGAGSRAIFFYAAKALDSVEWELLWDVLRSMGFGLHFISFVKLLYVSVPVELGRGINRVALSRLCFGD